MDRVDELSRVVPEAAKPPVDLATTAQSVPNALTDIMTGKDDELET